MAEHDDYIRASYAAHIEAVSSDAMMAAESIHQLAECLARTLLNGGKIICCSDDHGSGLAQIMASALAFGHYGARPDLPAIAITPTGLGRMSNRAADTNELFARQIKLLGNSNDRLMVFCTAESAPVTLINAVLSAADCGIPLSLARGSQENRIDALLQDSDTCIALSSKNYNRLLESNIVLINLLCELVEQQIFGTEITPQ